MKLKTTSFIIATLISSPFVTANSNINLPDSKQHYSGFSIGYGSNDFNISLQNSKQLNSNWSVLGVYEGDNNFNAHELLLDFQRRDSFGISYQYDYDSKYQDKDIRSNEYQLKFYRSNSLTNTLKLTPEISVGNLKHQGMSNSVYFTRAALDVTYKLTPAIWVGFAPEYTYSLGNIKETNGNQSNLRDWNYIVELGYEINKMSAFVYNYHYDDGDNLSLVSYKYRF